MGHRKISAAIKAEAVRLVIDGGHTAPQAAKLMGVGPTALRRWVDEWQAQQATMPQTLAEQQLLIAQLRGQLKAIEEERDVLKKQLPSHLARILKPRRSSRR